MGRRGGRGGVGSGAAWGEGRSGAWGGVGAGAGWGWGGVGGWGEGGGTLGGRDPRWTRTDGPGPRAPACTIRVARFSSHLKCAVCTSCSVWCGYVQGHDRPRPVHGVRQWQQHDIARQHDGGAVPLPSRFLWCSVRGYGRPACPHLDPPRPKLMSLFPLPFPAPFSRSRSPLPFPAPARHARTCSLPGWHLQGRGRDRALYSVPGWIDHRHHHERLRHGLPVPSRLHRRGRRLVPWCVLSCPAFPCIPLACA